MQSRVRRRRPGRRDHLRACTSSPSTRAAPGCATSSSRSPGVWVRRPRPGRRARGRCRRGPRRRSAWRPGWPSTPASHASTRSRVARRSATRGNMYSSIVEAIWVPWSSQIGLRDGEVLLEVGREHLLLPGAVEDVGDAALGLVGDVVAQRGGLPRLRLGLGASGSTARAAAARSWPEMVLSRASSSAIRVSSARPARASAVTSAQRRSGPTVEALERARCRRAGPRAGRAPPRCGPRRRTTTAGPACRRCRRTPCTKSAGGRCRARRPRAARRRPCLPGRPQRVALGRVARTGRWRSARRPAAA